MQFGLKWKLIGTTLVLLAILLVGSLTLVQRVVGAQLRRTTARELQTAQRVLEVFFDPYHERLLGRGQLLTELPSLKDAALNQPDALAKLLEDIRLMGTAPMLWVVEPTGRVLASTAGGLRAGTLLQDNAVVAQAMAGQRASGFVRHEDRAFFAACLPLTSSLDQSLIGVVALVTPINDGFLLQLDEATGAKVGLVWDQGASWSPAWPEAITQAVELAALRASPGRVTELRRPQRYLWLTAPAAPGEGGMQFVLAKRIDTDFIQRVSRMLSILGLTMMVVGFLALVGIGHSIVTPVRRLVADTKRLGAGALGHRAVPRGRDEIAELGRAFNQMAEQLESAHQALVQWNATLESRVEERTRQLQEAQQHLLQAQKLASIGQLAAGVAHEINNPLMVILGNAQLTLRQVDVLHWPKEGESQRQLFQELLQSLVEQARRCKTLVGDLLNFARSDSSAMSPVDLNAVLEESLQHVAHQAAVAHLTIVRDYAPSLPPLAGNHRELTQVFVNLLLNAVQAMPQGGQLQLRTTAADGRLVVTIADTGCGIPQEHLDKIFDPFFTTKEPGQGTGLGLAIVHGVVQRHQGTIDVKSRLGQGTAFTLTFPTQPTSPQAFVHGTQTSRPQAV